ncbi:hypothetical protein E5D57_000028 [Metarhizium anisopliae]|nr:hypothetical protein E5D57_000028 [Metarhizium anisopliae]
MEMESLVREALDPEQQELRMEAVLRRVVLPAVDQAVLPVLKKVESLKAVVEKQVLRLDSLEHEAGEAGLRVKRVKTSVDACCERVSSLANVATGLQLAGLVSQLRTLRVDVASVKEGIKAFSSLEREQRRLSAGGLAPGGMGSTVLGETDHTRQRKHRSHSESRETRTSSRKTVGHGDQDKKVRTEDVARKNRREAREKKLQEDSGNKRSDDTRERKSRRGSSRRSRSSSCTVIALATNNNPEKKDRVTKSGPCGLSTATRAPSGATLFKNYESGVWERYFERSEKVDQIFVRKRAEICMGQTKEIPRDEVPGGLGNEGRVTKSRGHSRPHMFGKGGPRPKAQAVSMSASLGDVSRQYWPAYRTNAESEAARSSGTR